mgnify:CR=1 FL=1
MAASTVGYLRDSRAHLLLDLPRLQQAGVTALFSYCGSTDLARSLRLIEATHRMVAAHPGEFSLIDSAEDIEAAKVFGKVGVDRDEPKSRRFHPPPYSRRIWPPPISPASVKKAREIMAGSPGGEESIGGGRESIWRMPHESGMGDENLRIRRRL